MKQSKKNVSPMSNEGRNTYVIEHITDALLQLLRRKSIKDISISELCELAGVGRASFYRNFESKEDILRAHIRQIWDEWSRTHKGTQPLSESLRSLFTHFEQHHTFYALLNKRNLIYLVKDVILEACGPQPHHSKEEAYTRAYFAYTLYGWLEVWFQRGMQESAEEIAEMFQQHGL